jgi:hypothetical protein
VLSLNLPQQSPTGISITAVIDGYLRNLASTSCHRTYWVYTIKLHNFIVQDFYNKAPDLGNVLKISTGYFLGVKGLLLSTGVQIPAYILGCFIGHR